MKSTPFDKILDNGSTIRGKYTLLIILAFATRLLAESVSVAEKKVQGTNAQKLNKKYGTPSESIFARLPNTTVKTNVENKG